MGNPIATRLAVLAIGVALAGGAAAQANQINKLAVKVR